MHKILLVLSICISFMLYATSEGICGAEHAIRKELVRFQARGARISLRRLRKVALRSSRVPGSKIDYEDDEGDQQQEKSVGELAREALQSGLVRGPYVSHGEEY